jgi:hypothetical protein
MGENLPDVVPPRRNYRTYLFGLVDCVDESLVGQLAAASRAGEGAAFPIVGGPGRRHPQMISWDD